MKKISNKRSLVLAIALSFVLFLIVFYSFELLAEILFSVSENVSLGTRYLSTQFFLTLFFSLIIGSTPILIYLLWRMAPVRSTHKKINSLLIVYGFMALFVAYRYFSLKLFFDNPLVMETIDGISIIHGFRIEDFNYEYFLFGGLVVGWLCCYFILKERD